MNKKFGRYELVTEIGRGGMAELWLGRLIGVAGFSKPVAIKRILPHLAEDPRFAQMFINEGTIAAKLSHPNICQVIELGEVEGELYLAMEYLEGVPWGELVHVLVKDPPAIARLAACVLAQAAEGLAFAHEQKVVHRDISPGNLFVTIDGLCKVLDFGVSKIATEQHETRSGMIKGKLPYMPPEQVRGEEVDGRVDVFAMGVVLWEALTGERLFVRANDYLIFQAILEAPIPSVAVPALGPAGPMLDAMLGRALERDRNKRYTSIRSFAEDLKAIANTLGGPVAPNEVGALVKQTFAARLADRSRVVAMVSSGAKTPPVERAMTEPDATRVPELSVALRGESRAIERDRDSSRLWWFIIGIAILGVTALVVAALTRGDHDAGPRDAPSLALGGSSVGSDGSANRNGGSDRHDGSNRIDDSHDGSDHDVGRIDAGNGRNDGSNGSDGSGSDSITIDPPTSGSEAPRPRPRPIAPAGRGFYSIDSKPYATIFVDGKKLDQTPIFKYPLSAGKHVVRAQLANGKSRTFTIKIEAEKELSSGTLSW